MSAKRIEAVLWPRRRGAERREGALSSRRSIAEQSVAALWPRSSVAERPVALLFGYRRLAKHSALLMIVYSGVTDKVMETAALNVTEEAGGGSLGLKDVAMREVHSPTMVQTVVAQIGQGLGIMCFLFHTLMILQFSAYKITKKGVKNDSAKPENRPPRVQL